MTDAIVLVGGQAVNFWADYYAGTDPELADRQPFTSKDIDFRGNKNAVEICAERLGGRALVARIDDHTVNVGKVLFVDDHGIKREIDFIDQPHGLSAKDVDRTAVPVKLLETAAGPSFKVMHPVLCMESRVCNTMGLPGYGNEHALNQLWASIRCAREFLLDLLDRGLTRDVLNLNERVFKFCTKHRYGRKVHAVYLLDPFDAVVSDERLPAKFRTIRLPQMRRDLETARQKVRDELARTKRSASRKSTPKER